MQLKPCKKQVVHIEDLLSMEAYAIVNNLCKLHQSSMVEAVSALQSEVVHIPSEVIKLVCINAVLPVGNDVVQKRRCEGMSTGTAMSNLEPRYQLANVANVEAVNVDLILINQIFKHHDGPSLMMPERMVVSQDTSADLWQKVIIKQMGKRAMAQVVAQTGEFNELN